MYILPNGNAVGENVTSDHDRAALRERDCVMESVEVLTLTQLAAQHGIRRCDFVKIDIEGADLLVLETGWELVTNSRPVILAEFNPYWMAQLKQDFTDVRRRFDPLNYEYFREVDGEFKRLTDQLVAKPGDVPTYLLLPAEKASSIF